MQLEIFFNAGTEFEILFNEQHFNVSAGSESLRIDYHNEYKKLYDIIIKCNNTEVLTKNIEITKIIFDNFWVLDNHRVAIAKNLYDSRYVDYANKNNIDIDYNVHNNNLLFFTGELVYTFYHPIWKFIHALH